MNTKYPDSLEKSWELSSVRQTAWSLPRTDSGLRRTGADGDWGPLPATTSVFVAHEESFSFTQFMLVDNIRF